MKNFTTIENLLTPTEAFSRIQALKTPKHDSITLELESAFNCINTQTLYAQFDSPLFNNAALDGYVFAYKEDTLEYDIKGVIYAGDEPQEWKLERGQCLKIMTGAMVPDGLDTLVPYEEAEEKDGRIILFKEPKKGQNVRKKREDFKKGAQIIPANTQLGCGDIALLASQGISTLQCFKPLNIAIVASGNELVHYKETLNQNQIYNSNALMLKTLLQSYDFHQIENLIVQDSKEELKKQILSLCERNDVILISGGASGGQKDWTSIALQEIGAKIIFHGINLKPGKPMLVAQYKNKIIFGLPGNPLGAFITAFLYAVPYLLKAQGLKRYCHDFVQAKLTDPIYFKQGRYKAFLGTLDRNWIKILKEANSSSISVLRQANALVLFSPDILYLNAQDSVKVIPLYVSNLRSSHFEAFNN